MNTPLLGFLVLGIHITGTIGLWGNLQMSFRPNPKANLNVVCKRTQSVLRGSTNFCSSKPELVRTVLNGIAVAVKECQHNFRFRKWNCSTVKRSIRKILQNDYRETAFVFAITSAGITHSVSKACAMGSLEACKCRANRLDIDANNLEPDDLYNKRSVRNTLPASEAEQKEFERNGCRVNFVEYGYQIAKQFVDREINRDAKALVTRHNNEAGRLAVKNYIERKCKCHGLSQTCTMKTCWRVLAPFTVTSDRIKTHFDGAIKVFVDNNGERLVAEEPTVKPPTSEDLVYTTKSPDFCNREKETGSLGTSGRRCNITSLGTGGCELLCCGRGHKTKDVTEHVNCECIFYWCCEVRCKTCKQERTIHTCV